YEQPLAVLARRHDVIPVVLTDPVEEKLPDVGGLWPIVDAETGGTVLVDLSDEGTRRAWEARAAERVQKRDRTFRRLPLEAVPPGAPQPRSHREELGNGKARTVFELTLADYGTLEPRVPDLLLAVSGPDGPRQLQVRGRPLKFRSLVQEEGQASPERAHHGPKPPVGVMVRSFLWVWLLGGL